MKNRIVKITSLVILFFIAQGAFAQNAQYKTLLNNAKNYESQKKYVYALCTYYDAMEADPANATEALDAFNKLADIIRAGNPGRTGLNTFDLYDNWVLLLQEFEKYWTENCPRELIFGKFKKTAMDRNTRTSTFEIKVRWEWSYKYWKVAHIVIAGLKKARSKDWEEVPINWPRISVYSKNFDKKTYLKNGAALLYSDWNWDKKVYPAALYTGGSLDDYSYEDNTYDDKAKSSYDIKFSVKSTDGKTLLTSDRTILIYDEYGYDEDADRYLYWRTFTFSGVNLTTMDLIDQDKIQISLDGMWLNYGAPKSFTNDNRDWITPLPDVKQNAANVLCLSPYSNAREQDASVKVYNAKFTNLYEQGKYADALAVANTWYNEQRSRAASNAQYKASMAIYKTNSETYKSQFNALMEAKNYSEALTTSSAWYTDADKWYKNSNYNSEESTLATNARTEASEAYTKALIARDTASVQPLFDSYTSLLEAKNYAEAVNTANQIINTAANFSDRNSKSSVQQRAYTLRSDARKAQVADLVASSKFDDAINASDAWYNEADKWYYNSGYNSEERTLAEKTRTEASQAKKDAIIKRDTASVQPLFDSYASLLEAKNYAEAVNTANQIINKAANFSDSNSRYSVQQRVYALRSDARKAQVAELMASKSFNEAIDVSKNWYNEADRWYNSARNGSNEETLAKNARTDANAKLQEAQKSASIAKMDTHRANVENFMQQNDYDNALTEAKNWVNDVDRTLGDDYNKYREEAIAARDNAQQHKNFSSKIATIQQYASSGNYKRAKDYATSWYSQASSEEERTLVENTLTNLKKSALAQAYSDAIKAGKLHNTIDTSTLQVKKGECTAKKAPSGALAKAGVQKDDVITGAKVKTSDGKTATIDASSIPTALLSVMPPSTLTITVTRGKKKNAQTLNLNVPVEYNASEKQSVEAAFEKDWAK